MSRSRILILLALISVLPASERLTPGLHDITTSREGITCTVAVPAAIADGKPLPLVVLMCGDGKPDTKAWEEWSAGSGMAVVGINGLTWMTEINADGGVDIPKGSENFVDRTRKGYQAALAAVQQRIPVHPFLRYLVNARVTATQQPQAVEGLRQQFTPGAFAKQQVAALLDDREQPFAGVLTLSELTVTRKDVAVIVISSTEESSTFFGEMDNEPKADGPVTRVINLGKIDNANQIEYLTAGVGLLADLVSITHERLTSVERRDNLDAVAAKVQEIAGVVNPYARRSYADFLASLPGMSKRRRDHERLMDIWVETSIIIAKEHEKENLPEAYAYLSLVVRSERHKAAGPKQRKAAQDELARMRKDPVIKREQVAYDILVDTCAMLEKDKSISKRRIALKQLEEIVAKYPATLAGKQAVKLVDILRKSVR